MSANIEDDASVLEQEVQRSVDRYRKWLVEMCRRTVNVDAGLSGGRIGRLRRRRDREFERLMRRYCSIPL